MRKRLFVDMDGTLATFNPAKSLEDLFEKGYFRNLSPQESVVDAVKNIIKEQSDSVEVFILSAVLSDSLYALDEKNEWIDEFLPEIDKEHRIFPPCGEDKTAYVPGGIKNDDFLLDDYTVNLNQWEPPARGIKLMNGINGTKGTWKGEKISMFQDGNALKEQISELMEIEHSIDRLQQAKEEEWDRFHKICFDKTFPKAAETVKNSLNDLLNSGMDTFDAVQSIQDYMDENFGKGNYTVAAIPPGLILKSQEMKLSTLKDLDRMIKELPVYTEKQVEKTREKGPVKEQEKGQDIDI